MLLDIEARIGELLPDVNRVPKKDADTKTFMKDLPEGIDKKKVHQARAIKNHPEIVEKFKAQARENEDIPMKTAVLHPHRKQKNSFSRSPPYTRNATAGSVGASLSEPRVQLPMLHKRDSPGHAPGRPKRTFLTQIQSPEYFRKIWETGAEILPY